jgi:amino acid adenylation domain-containing protein/non-ribosomal peptide synthase protein (TIGR01720 family)
MENKEYYPLTPSQERMFFIKQLNKGSTAYNSPIVRRIKGNLDMDGLRRAFKKLLQRHEPLRTGFTLVNGEPVQRSYKIKIEDFSFTYWENSEENQLQNRITHFIQPFDLESPPLLRAGIIKRSEKDFILIMDSHHMISDLKSEDILIRDLFRLYNNELLPELKWQYKEYAQWCKENLSLERLKKEEQYWLSKFKGELPVLNLSTDLPRPQVFSFKGTISHYRLNDRLTEAIKIFAEERVVSLYNIFLTAFFILLYRYTDQEDVIVGMPEESRQGFDNTIGLFINTLPIRNNPMREKSFWHLLFEVIEDTKQSFNHFNYDLGYLVDKLGIKRDPSRNPLYDTLFFYNKLDTLTMGELEVSPFEFIHEKAEFDITLGILEIDDHYHFSIEYNSDIFKPGTIQRMSLHYQNILNDVINNREIRLKDIGMLSEEEKRQILFDFNDTGVDFEYPWFKTIHGLFQEQVGKRPDSMSVVFGDKSITYKVLNERTNQLARRLRKNSAAADAAAGILVEPCLDRIISVLGILKSGSAYLPIDPVYPDERIDYMLKDSRAQMLLTQTHLIKRVHFKNIINVEKEKGNGSKRNLASRSGPGSPAYIIYTSGSTGRPKGTLIEHGSVINLSDWHNKTFSVTPEDRATWYAGFGFDASVWEIFPYLFKGASLYIVDPGTRLDPRKLNAWLNRNKISIAFLPTRMAEVFMTLENTSLRILLIGGDKLKTYQKTRYQLVNNYGVTEGTVVNTCFFVKRNVPNIPIGKPISNTRIYILNRDKKLQPIGVPGELCISGAGLARGYLNNPDLTAESFNRSYMSYMSYRSYYSGDLARWLPDGNIEFLGRIDHQVKIQGYRIEPEEIESTLKEHPAVKEAVVLVNDFSGETMLTAYVVPREEIRKNSADNALDIRGIRYHLKESLPEWMVPKRFILLDSIPLCPSGKTNRNALPEPSEADLFINEAYLPPTNETEEKLKNLWQEILNVETIGITDNFFDLGGHSIKAALVSAAIEKEFKTDFPLLEIFRKPTIKEIAPLLEGNTNKRERKLTDIPLEEKQSYYPLTPSEIMIYILHQSGDNNLSYNSVFPMILEGRVDRERLNVAIQTMVRRHEAFRSGYEIVNGAPVKIIYQQVHFNLECREGNEEAIESIIEKMKQPYDLRRPPLFRAILVTLSREKHLCVIANHHIVSDGVTEAVFMREISDLYQREKLKDVKLQYKDFTLWQKRLLNSGRMKRQEQYWLNKYKGEIPILNLPLDYSRPSRFVFEGGSVSDKADKELTEMLYTLAKKDKTTLFMVLLAAYTTLLYRYTGQEDIIVGSPIANRQHPDVQEVTGILLNMIAIRNFPKPEKTFRQFLKEVRINALADYNYQEYPFYVLIDKLRLKRDASRNPLFNTIFVLQNTEPALLKIQGLKIVPYAYQNKTAKFDLSLEAVEVSGEIELNVEYCTKLFKEETIRGFCTHFKNLLYEIVNHFEKRLCEMEILSGREKNRLLFDFNNTASAYPYDKTIPELFEEQADRTGDCVAVIGTMSMTYRELNKKSNQLAGILIEKGVKPDTIVGLLVERSLETMVGILGILKAGGAYLPIDPDYPTERLHYMLADSGAKILLKSEIRNPKSDATLRSSSLRSTRTNSNVQNINDQNKNLGTAFVLNFENLNFDIVSNFEFRASNLSSSNLAYLIYTSGTTGKPKGVMIEHRHVVRLLFNDHFQFDFTDKDTWTLFHSICFDFSIWEMYGALLRGGRLMVVPKEMTHDLRAYAALLRGEQVTILNQTPSVFMHLMEEELSYPDRRLYLRYVMLGGEALQPETLNAWQIRYPNCKLINLYGITETTVIVTSKEITGYEMTHNMSNIGKPFPTLSTYVMDKMLHLAPIGVPGELCIGGAGVGQGYINRPALTAEKFVMNPYKPGERIYRSGDWIKMLNNGEMIYLERLDRQINIRGFRIELGEIESCLSEHHALKQCAVTLYKSSSSGEKYITAYYIAKQKITQEALRVYLLERLPSHMIPNFFLEIAQFPLTVNGKIDYDALPAPDRDSLQTENYAAPRNETEKMLVNVWRDILDIKDVGVFDNFFEIGGTSLNALQIVSRLKKKGYRYHVSVNDIYHAQTIARLVSFLDKKKEPVPSKTKEPVSGIPLFLHKKYPNNGFSLSAVQSRFFQRQLNNIHIFNTPFLAELKQYIKPTIIKRALKKITAVHHSLLLRFQKESDTGNWYQFYGEFPSTTYFRCINLSGIEKERHHSFISEYCARVQYQFDLSKGPLFKVILFDNYCQNKRQVLFLVFFHLSFDGVSLEIFLQDFKNLCLKRIHHQPLKEKEVVSTSSYKEWCLKLEEYAKTRNLEPEKEYWNKILKDGRSFPVDTMPDKWPYHRDMEHFRTNVLQGRETVEKIFLAVRTYQCSPLILLLAGLYSACRECKNQTDLLLHIMTNQRESFFPGIDVHRTIGFFAGAYPVRILFKEENGPSLDYQTIINGIKASLYSVPRAGLDYFVLKYLLSEFNHTQSDLIDPSHMLFHFSDQQPTQNNDEDFYLPLDIPFGDTSSPDNKSAYLLNITAVLGKESLDLTCYYSTLHYKKDTILEFSKAFVSHLKKVIEIVTTQSNSAIFWQNIATKAPRHQEKQRKKNL